MFGQTNRLMSLVSLSVHLLVFEKRSEPAAHHGAPLHRQQVPGGAEQNVQPDVQDSLPVQTSSSAPEEGNFHYLKRLLFFLSSFIFRLSWKTLFSTMKIIYIPLQLHFHLLELWVSRVALALAGKNESFLMYWSFNQISAKKKKKKQKQQRWTELNDLFLFLMICSPF